jgi:hypothetical protein
MHAPAAKRRKKALEAGRGGAGISGGGNGGGGADGGGASSGPATAKDHLGVTPPLSLDPPTPADEACTAQLTACLEAAGLFEGPEESQRRKDVLAVVDDAIHHYFQGLALARGLSKRRALFKVPLGLRVLPNRAAVTERLTAPCMLQL